MSATLSSRASVHQGAVSKAAAGSTPEQRRRAVYAGGIGSLVEYYDFGVYGYVATTIAIQFFPTSSPTAGLLSTLAVFAIAFVARPLGSILFGHIGDRHGRKPALAISVIMMAIATFGIGCLPTYETIGVAAPLLLVIMRLAQGLSAGGEVSGSAAILAETALPNRRGFLTSATQVGSLSGLLLASAVVGIINWVLTPEQFTAWGWRIPFLLGILTGFVGLWVRIRLQEAEAFKRVEQTGKVAELPVVEVFRTNSVNIAKAFGLTAINFAAYYTVFVYLSIYLQTVGTLTKAQATFSTTTTIAIAAVALVFFGLLSDIIGRKLVIGGSALGFLVLTIPAFKIMQGDNLPLIFGAQVVLGLLEAAIMGAIWAALAELFPTRVRYSGIGLGFNLAGVFVGGSAPYISTWLIQATGDKISPAYFLMAVSVITLATLMTVPETAKKAMPE